MSSPRTIETIFDLAISREEAAHKLYVSLSNRVKNPAVKETFDALAIEELKHKTLLLSLKKEPLTYTKFKPVADFHVAETEAKPDVKPDMPLRDAVVIAMQNEQQAAIMYRTMAEFTTDTDMRILFENLTNMELGHKNSLETLFVDIGYPEVF